MADPNINSGASMQHSKPLLLISLLVLLTTAQAESAIYTSFLSNSAVSGYDPVSYFTEGKPEKGKSRFKLRYKSVDWYFTSRQHREMFQQNPARYMPQYGGYCAWAVAHNTTAKGDPLHWTIYQDKLYLNYDKKIQADWAKDKSRRVQEANSNWPKVIN
jgi:YHS domain-containing protein